jgi:hypothetical protein
MTDRIRWKPDHKGRPRRMPASHIVAHDVDAKAAFDAMCKRMPKAEAEREVEEAFWKSFLEQLVLGIDRRLEIWISLEEGLRAKDLFADAEVILNGKLGENAELIESMRRKKHQFVSMEAMW